MKILLVAMTESVHTVRWYSQFRELGWDIRVFPSIDHGRVHPELKAATVYHSIGGRSDKLFRKLRLQTWRVFTKGRSFIGVRLLPRLRPQRRAVVLQRIITEFQPDIVHSLEFQAAGYLTASVKKKMGPRFPVWIATNWGSDIYHFAQFPEHEVKIREVLANCDYYSCECQRDVCLAKGYGLRGQVLPVFPNAGGFDLSEIGSLRQVGPVSARRLLMLKGYQHWVGRALVGLEALERCIDLISDYEIVLYSTSPETVAAAKTFHDRTGIKVRVIPHNTSHREILKLHGRARISIGLSLSDGVSTSFLEALAMGAFPVQSWTACADEWVDDGISGLLVPPEDVAVVETAIRQALTDDDLVNSAAERNYQVTEDRLDSRLLTEMAISMYRRVAEEQEVIDDI